MCDRRLRTVAWAVLLAVGAGAADLARAEKPAPQQFFSTVAELDGSEVERLRAELLRVAGECTRIGKKCPAADDLLRLMSGEQVNPALPVLIVYLDKNLNVAVNGMIWKRRLTPYVYGVDSLSLLVVSERPLDLQGRLTVLLDAGRSFTTPFVSIGRQVMDAREASVATEAIALKPIGDAGPERRLWIGSQRFFLDRQTAYRLSLIPEDGGGEPAPFNEVRAQLSNASGRPIDFGVGLGATLVDFEDSKNTTGVNTGSASLDIYWLLHLYLKKPVLVKPIGDKWGGRYRPSWALTFGFNLKLWETEEFIIGANWGHLFGRHGVVFGVNFINPFQESDEPSSAHGFVGFNFNF